MKKLAKRTAGAFLGFVLCFSLIPSSAFADTQIETAEVQSENVLTEQAAHTEKNTALGLFKYIKSQAAYGSAEYVDAQCAIDILTGKTTKGITYPANQGTETFNNADAYKLVNFKDPNDASSLVNLEESLQWIDTYNKYRKEENQTEKTQLATNIGTNCRMLAISIVQCAWSKNRLAHSQVFNVGENLSWGYTDPFYGWYTEEKKLHKMGKPEEAGHYYNIIDKWGGNTVVTGFAVSKDSSTWYGVCHEQSFYVQYGNFNNPNVIYSTSNFKKKWLNPYKKTLVVKEKKANTLKAKSKKKTVVLSAATLKKKKLTFSNISISSAKGKVSFKNVSTNKASKKIPVNASNGKLTIPRNAKKGKYPVLVQVTAAGSSTYKAKKVVVGFYVVIK